MNLFGGKIAPRALRAGTFATAALALLAAPRRADAYVFLFADPNGADIVAHPVGYSGTGAVLNVTVGINPASPHAADMVTPTQNVISTWNALVPTTGNIIGAPSSGVPSNAIDFESTALHEMGHALGLDHPNLGARSGLTTAQTDFTNALKGTNNAYDLSAGPDGVIGSADDVRGDDVNLNYFRKSNNNPFTIDSVVDKTTYSRNLADLPVGSIYSANASRDVATLLGVPNTEAVMQQGQPFGEAQRTLGHDDVAGIRYAMSGLDELAGTADDYTFQLTYAGFTTQADIVLDFDSSQFQPGGLAFTLVNGDFVSPLDYPNHIAVTSADMYFDDAGLIWFFNPVPVPEPTAAGLLAAAGLLLLRRPRRA